MMPASSIHCRLPANLEAVAPFFHDGILKFFVFLAQLLGDRLKAFPDNGLILSVGVFYHVIFIRAYNITLNLQNLVHALCIYKSLHGIRHTAYNGILQ